MMKAVGTATPGCEFVYRLAADGLWTDRHPVAPREATEPLDFYAMILLRPGGRRQ